MNNGINSLTDIKELALKKDFPYSATIEIITKCNFNCVHCYIPDHVDEMDFGTIKHIVDQLYDLGIFQITLTGGEVAVHSSFMQVVRYIREKGIKLELFSNISLFTEDIMIELAKRTVSVSTTLFSLDSRINDSITKYYRSAEIVCQKAIRLKQLGIEVDVKVPIMKKNSLGYKDIIAKFEEYEIPVNYSVAITPRTNGDCKPMEYALSQKELDDFIMENVTIEPQEFRTFDKEEYLCTAVGNALAIDVKGNVYPCNSFLYLYGNIHSNSLREIWYELPERKRLKSYKKADVKPCLECELNHICKRCPGLSYDGNENFDKCPDWDRMIALSKMKKYSSQRNIFADECHMTTQ